MHLMGDTAIKFNAICRTLIGITALASPKVAAKAMGTTPSSSMNLISRIAGIRDCALGVGYLTAKPDARRNWQLAAMACDVSDAAAAAAELKAPKAPRAEMWTTVGIAGASVLQHAIALVVQSRPSSGPR